ncbi:MAG: adenylosuccinate lyase [Calditrichaeota bacterium]|nr:MAG: adenylosuccinate lyase [Calditrichota bacterium]
MDKSISPLDGRYGKRLEHLGEYFSEYALMRMRIITELRFLEALNRTKLFKPLSVKELETIHSTENNFSENDYKRIKEIEAVINHDVKSCEIFLQERLGLNQPNMIHFGLTSEDVNNLAYTFLFKEYVEKEQLPQLKELIGVLTGHAKNWADIPFPARTHGQIASPTTGGKEMAVFIARLIRQYNLLKNFIFTGKLNGATGNYSALSAAFPDYDWLKFSGDFLAGYGLEPNLVTTQIEDHDNWAQYFSITRQINHIVLDLDRDIWLYLTLGYLTIDADKGAVGSSTMPHKVNPINFENSEGNVQVSNSVLGGLIDKLGNSRMQRDLSDSTSARNIGVGLSHSYLAVSETIRGLKKLQINQERCLEELNNHPELLAEPVQTILRREGVDNPYNLLKDITRGKRVNLEELRKFIGTLDVSDKVKKQLLSLEPAAYLGEAVRITKMVVSQAEDILNQ